jgi:hypothetical protein
MKEKVKEKQDTKPAPEADAPSVFDAKADAPPNKNVTVSSGPYLEELPVAGMKVSEVRRKFGDRFDINKDSVAVIDGKNADESHILKTGEGLMFIRHAGEKGAINIQIQGLEVCSRDADVVTARMFLPRFMERLRVHSMSTGPCVLPTGIKAVFSRGNYTIWVWERAPALQKVSWIAPDSPTPYGKSTKYMDVTIALPYLYIITPFSDGKVINGDECFFGVKQLKSLDDELLYPGLLNCSKWNQVTNQTPLSWICTQNMMVTQDMVSTDLNIRMAAGFEAVRHCLLESSFNLSSEHHEDNSWYNASKYVDPRISTIGKWEKASERDPLFVLDVPWIKTKHTVKQIAERIFNRFGVVDTAVKEVTDLARIVANG